MGKKRRNTMRRKGGKRSEMRVIRLRNEKVGIEKEKKKEEESYGEEIE